MPTDTSVKFLHSAMSGAPSLTGQAGSLVALLDACLVNGFGLVSVDSIAIAGGIGTITRGAGMPFEAGAVVSIAGATVTGGSVNGDRKLVTVGANTATFDATGLANQAATGAITVKMAPLGWAKTYAGTNLAAYKPTDVAATGCLLRVDDTGAQTARVRGYESMTDINTGTGPFPTDAQVSGGHYWPKSTSSDATTRQWILVGDGRLFYLMSVYSGTGTNFGLDAVFGDIQSVKSPDAYACVLNGFTSSALGTAGGNSVDYDAGDAAAGSAATLLARGYAGVGGPVAARKAFPLIANTGATRSGAAGLPYPNFADGGVYLAPHHLVENAAGVLRGFSPGLFCFPQTIGAAVFSNRDVLAGVAGYAGKVFRIVNSGSGCFAFDTTGPWR